MRRAALHEIHDHPRCPSLLRDLFTDALQSIWNFTNSYEPVVAKLLESMEMAGTRGIVDLCSGAGGPWFRLLRGPKLMLAPRIEVLLTDRYPNRSALLRARAAAGQIHVQLSPVDATAVPSHLMGFRTVFSSFHHFEPDAARAILEDAMINGNGVGVFEAAHCSIRTLLSICTLPLLAMILTPSIRPFRWERVLWTYLIPIVPFVLFYDGVVSCLRAYSLEELEELIAPLKRGNYVWQIGEDRTGFLPVTYLLGHRPAKLSLQTDLHTPWWPCPLCEQ